MASSVSQPCPTDIAPEASGAWINGDLAESAMLSEILGEGPFARLRWLVMKLARCGQSVKGGGPYSSGA